jgi:tetratricopeptide (TPR) repeat protein
MALLELKGENYEEAIKHLDEALRAPHDTFMLIRIYEIKASCYRLQGSGLPKALDLHLASLYLHYDIYGRQALETSMLRLNLAQDYLTLVRTYEWFDTLRAMLNDLSKAKNCLVLGNYDWMTRLRQVI